MAYTTINFKTKKALKDAVERYNALTSPKGQRFQTEPAVNASPVRAYQPGLGPDLSEYTGVVTLEGPHFPQPHRWYAQAQLVNGVVVSVK